MTVTYTAQVATCRGFGCFLKLLFRWRGSIYKLVWLDLVIFLLAYYILNIVYRTVLNEEQRLIFEGLVKYCAIYSNLIPLSFVLGFYVSIVMTRWWNQYISIPWPDPIAVFVSSTVHGQDERGRVMRRTIMRYVCLCLTMVLSNISPRVKKRFPTPDHLVEAGLLLENEKKIIDELNRKFPRHSKHWLPIVWAASIVTRARKEGRIRDDFAVKTVIDELNKFRGQCGLLISYDTISIPLVYTQVVTLAVYTFFITSLMGQQWIHNKTTEDGYLNTVDLYFPIFTTLQFFFYMGWLKVAESLINPFGEDDDDFEVNWMVDRNLQVSYMIVDEMHHDHPELLKDQYWDEIFPAELPYTVAAEKNREEHPEPSTANIEVSYRGAAVIPVAPSNLNLKAEEMVGKSNQSVNYKFPEPETNENFDDNGSGIHFTAGSRRSHERMGSTASMGSLAGTVTRVNTVAGALKKFFNRGGEDSRSMTGSGTVESGTGGRLANSASTASIRFNPGTMKITDQVIEEGDEQMTITSMGKQVLRPTAQSIFETVSPPPPTAPVDIPVPSSQAYQRTQSAVGHVSNPPHTSLFPEGGVESLLSTSAPPIYQIKSGTTEDGPKNTAEDFNRSRLGSSGTNESVPVGTENVDNKDEHDDEFEKLRIAREKERLDRQMSKLSRSISSSQQAGAQGLSVFDADFLLEQITTDNTNSSRNSYQEPKL